MKQRTTLFAASAAILLAVAGCSRGPAPEMAPAYVGTWHIAGQADPTTLTFGEDTFTFIVGDGSTVLQPLVPPEEGAENVATMLTVSGSLSVEGDTSFKLTVPEDGVSIEFVDGVGELEQELSTASFTVLFRGLSEEPMLVDIDDAGTTMTMIGLFSGILTAPDLLASLTACRDAPCAGA
ncbi:MAG: hypothetical protein OXQ31_10385 [Spirochaetaceae bacterium]|nr:hypothetical protein [Spirochaetaceae bacterium]